MHYNSTYKLLFFIVQALGQEITFALDQSSLIKFKLFLSRNVKNDDRVFHLFAVKTSMTHVSITSFINPRQNFQISMSFLHMYCFHEYR